MATLELVEKLRTHANVSYDDAKEALDACGDDILEALIYLERHGKVRPPSTGGAYSTKEGFSPGATPQRTPAYTAPPPPKGESFSDMMRKLWNWIKGVVHKGNTNMLSVTFKDGGNFSLPITVLVLLLCCAFWVTLPLLVIGLFLGCKYRFAGPNFSQNGVANNVMNSASKTAEDIKTSVKNAAEGGDEPVDRQ